MKKELYDKNSITYNEKDGVPFVQFANLLKYGELITHCFTTRLGGVSKGECSSLNMGFNRKDTRENVLENYRRISNALDIDYRNMVFSNQVHENKIKQVDEEDRGKGILLKSDIIGYDGLMTNKRQVVLVTFYADCVPLFFLDPVSKAIALSHSGWRSTVQGIGVETLGKMQKAYGCKPEHMEVAIGPSIGGCCFEVGEEVYREFKDKYHWVDEFSAKTEASKWHIDLQGIIKRTLVNYGLNEENICISHVCTKCNKDKFFSHRGDQGRTGSLAAILQLN